MLGKLFTLTTLLLLSSAAIAELGENPTQNTDDTERDSFVGPQQQILPQIEQVGRVLSTGYKSHKVSREASKQKTECTGCKRKRKFSLDVKIKLATSASINGTPYALLDFTEGSEQHQLFQKLHTSSPEARKEVFKEIKSKVGCGQGMIDFMAKVGNEMADIYDTARSRAAASAKGTKTCEDMFSAFNEIKNNPSSSAKSGVCRDHTVCLATMMAEMCPKLGKNTCSVTYSTPGNYHQTLVTQIGNKTHHFSYNARMNTAKSGVGGMSVVKDNSLSYRIWCGDGSGNMQTVQQIPSELGFIFNEVMGRDNARDFDPMARPLYDLQKVQITSDSGQSQANMFRAKMSNGDVIYGVAASSSYSELANLHTGDTVTVNIVAEGHSGVATAYRKISQQYVINEGEDHQYIIGLNLQQELKIPATLNLAIGKLTGEISADIHILGITTMTIGKGESSGGDDLTTSAYDGTWSGSALLSSNLRAGVRLDRRDSSFGLNVHRQITPGLHDSRSLEFAGARVITNFDHYRADARFRLAPEFEIDGAVIYQVNGASDSIVLRRLVGGEIGVRTPAFFSRVRVMGTLQNEVNLNYLPGGSAPINANLEVGRGFQITDTLRLDTSGSINVDSYGSGGAFLNLGLSYDHY